MWNRANKKNEKKLKHMPLRTAGSSNTENYIWTGMTRSSADGVKFRKNSQYKE